MSNVIETGGIDVVILCGGLGKRLRPILNDRPKAMAEINNRPFLDILIDYISSFGFRRLILCIGYLGNAIKQYYQNKKTHFEIIFSEEKNSLGTAGAVKNAEPFIRSTPFLVMNGDSFCPLNVHKFLTFHIAKQSELSQVLVKMKKTSCNGMVKLDEASRIVEFAEKENKGDSFSNAGVYLFNRSILALIPPDTVYSLEHDLFPSLTQGNFYGYVTEEDFIDIGTPNGYNTAKQRLLRIEVQRGY